MRTFECRLPMPPTLNNLFPTSRSGHRFPSKAYKAWRLLSERYWIREVSIVPVEQLNGKIRAIYTMHFKTKRRSDCFNFEKAISDFLVTKGIIHDDCDIDDGRVIRGSPAGKNAYVEVRLEEME